MNPIDPTQRFSDRVENYIRYRPGYPREILEPLRRDCNLCTDSVIADIGSGTGILTRLFLENGNRVFGVEPNREMRQAGERLLQSFDRLASVSGAAEATTLPDQSVDFVTVGQAFHWFNPERARAEFRRILRPAGWVVLIWNDRRTDSRPFLAEYENLLRKSASDYEQVNHKRIDAAVLRDFFQAEPLHRKYPNSQQFDLPGLTGRVLSASYVPGPGQPGHEEMLAALAKLFAAHQQQDRVTFEYDTNIYYGQLTKPRVA